VRRFIEERYHKKSIFGNETCRRKVASDRSY
jgi:hypothetical protein